MKIPASRARQQYPWLQTSSWSICSFPDQLLRKSCWHSWIVFVFSSPHRCRAGSWSEHLHHPLLRASCMSRMISMSSEKPSCIVLLLQRSSKTSERSSSCSTAFLCFGTWCTYKFLQAFSNHHIWFRGCRRWRNGCVQAPELYFKIDVIGTRAGTLADLRWKAIASMEAEVLSFPLEMKRIEQRGNCWKLSTCYGCPLLYIMKKSWRSGIADLVDSKNLIGNEMPCWVCGHHGMSR